MACWLPTLTYLWMFVSDKGTCQTSKQYCTAQYNPKTRHYNGSLNLVAAASPVSPWRAPLFQVLSKLKGITHELESKELDTAARNLQVR